MSKTETLSLSIAKKKKIPALQNIKETLTKLPETNMTSHPKMNGWNTILSYRVLAYFQGRTVSFREGTKLWSCSELPVCRIFRS